MTTKPARDRVALVTGASSGLGRAFARALLEDGHPVVAAARRVERMTDLAAAGALVLPMDITRDDEVRAVAERVMQDHGAVDILVNNAGFGLYGAMEDVPLDAARYQFEVNLFGLARLTQLLLPGMRARGGGRIVNLSSMGGASTSRSAAGATRPSTPSRAGPTACGSSWRRSGSMSSSSSRA